MSTEDCSIHQYDAIDREQTWPTLSIDLPDWHASLRSKIKQAARHLES